MPNYLSFSSRRGDCLDRVKEWMRVNKLRLNPGKTRFVDSDSVQYPAWSGEIHIHPKGAYLQFGGDSWSIIVRSPSGLTWTECLSIALAHLSTVTFSKQSLAGNFLVGLLQCVVCGATFKNSLETSVGSKLEWLDYSLGLADMHILCQYFIIYIDYQYISGSNTKHWLWPLKTSRLRIWFSEGAPFSSMYLNWTVRFSEALQIPHQGRKYGILQGRAIS